jgi:hypothetical protein
MKHILIALLLGITVSGGPFKPHAIGGESMADDRMSILNQLVGEPYIRERDRLLSDPAGLSVLVRDHSQSPDWRTLLQANILDARLTRAALFQQFHAELDKINVDEEQVKMGGMARIMNLFEERGELVYKQPALPIWWEILLKFHADWPSWKVVAAIRCLEGVPDSRSIDPLIWIIRQSEKDDIVDAAARALIKMTPKEKAHRELENLADILGRKQDLVQEALEEIIPNP